jgi:radical SAM superfamily enzyme YgiQ (UPF0313 family)
MRIGYVWPHGFTAYQTLPFSLGLLQANVPGHEARLFNLPLEGWTADAPAFAAALRAFRPDLVAISAWAVTYRSAVDASRIVRAAVPGARVVLGGHYATLCPREAFAPGCFHYLLRGEAERSFPAFVRALEAGDRPALAAIDGIYFVDERGHEIRRPRPPLHADLDELGTIDYEFLQLERALRGGYLRSALGPRRKISMLASRGCRHGCRFCTVQAMNGGRLRHYSADYLVREIRRLYDRYRIRGVVFQDDNIGQDRAFFADLLRRITALRLPGLELELGLGLRLETLDEELLVLMKQAGCRRATIAPESGSSRVRGLMGKAIDRAAIDHAARLVRAAGLSLQGFFIVGYPGERPAERHETYRMIRDLRFDVFSLHKYQAIPGSASFRQLVADGRIAPGHTDESHLIGERLPNYNGEDDETLDRELLLAYARAYLRRPWKLVELLRMASLGGLGRDLSGTLRSGLAWLLPRRISRPAR